MTGSRSAASPADGCFGFSFGIESGSKSVALNGRGLAPETGHEGRGSAGGKCGADFLHHLCNISGGLGKNSKVCMARMALSVPTGFCCGKIKRNCGCHNAGPGVSEAAGLCENECSSCGCMVMGRSTRSTIGGHTD